MQFDLALKIWPELAWGAWTTVKLVSISTLIGFVVVALPLGVMRRAASRPLRAVSKGYDFVFRGTPLIVLLYIVYYGLSSWSVVRDSFLWMFLREPYFCALLALSLNTGAYGAEIVQGAMGAVDRGLREAGLSLGLKRWQVFATIEAPVAMRYGLAPYLHEIIQLTKSTAVVSTITILDLMGAASAIYAETLDPFTPMLCAGVVYLVLILALTWLAMRLERRVYRGQDRTATSGPTP